MTTHRRAALLLRGCAVTALCTGAALGITASPAFADGDIKITIAENNIRLTPGNSGALVVTVTNSGDKEIGVTLSLNLPNDVANSVTAQSATCSDNPCVLADKFAPGSSKTITWRLTESQNPNIQPGKTNTGTGSVKATATGGSSGSASANYQVSAAGAAAPSPSPTPTAAQTVNEVSGSVIDATTGQPVKDAAIVLIDGGSNPHKVGSDPRGSFKITAQPNNPIVPGNLRIAATKDGFATSSRTVTAAGGQSVTGVTMKLSAANASQSASPSEEQSSASTTEDASAAASGSAPAARKPASSGSSMPFVLVGVLLVLIPVVGGLIYLWRKRRANDDEEDDYDGGPDGPQGGYPGRGGRPDVTRLAAPGMNDATAIVPGPGMQADPYRTGPQPYTGGPSGYGLSGYDDQTQVAGYGQGGYDDRTQVAGYGQGGFDDRTQVAGYGQGGYDDRTQVAGYDPRRGGPSGGQPQYDPGYGPQQGGYGQQQPGGYPQGGYDDRTQVAGYDQGYDQQGGYPNPNQGRGGQPRRNPPPQDRRSVEWLDD